MKYIRQFCIILGISFIGEILNRLIPLPIPAGIYGIILLFTGLATHLIPLEAVRETGRFLVEIMPVMFIPAAVGLMDSWDLLKNNWLPYVIVTLATMVAVMAVAGRVTQFVIRHTKGSDGND